MILTDFAKLIDKHNKKKGIFKRGNCSRHKKVELEIDKIICSLNYVN